MNDKFDKLIERAEHLIARIESILPQPLSAPADWNASIAWRYRRRSTGHGVLEPVRTWPQMPLDSLKEIDVQKEKIERNTQQFVEGKPANNVLLTGARGTGKSSLIRACLQTYAPQGLRLIEVDKAELVDLPDIVEVVSQRPREVHRVQRRPELRRGRARLQGAEVHPRRIGGRVDAQRADLRDQQPAPPAARVHEGQPQLHPHRGRRGAPRRGDRGEDLAVGALRLWVSFYPFSQNEYLTITASGCRRSA
jgi:hypothetical protein